MKEGANGIKFLRSERAEKVEDDKDQELEYI